MPSVDAIAVRPSSEQIIVADFDGWFVSTIATADELGAAVVELSPPHAASAATLHSNTPESSPRPAITRGY